ncbi:MAG: class I SAM-dependent methyltransferase, partial [Mycobacteriaceae bacterium]
MDAADWDKRYSDSELVWGAPPNRYVVQHATSLPAGRALDLACGEGRN